jgi:hypothetical protein
MTVTTTSPEPQEPPASGRTKRLVIAVVVAIVVMLGIKLVFVRWVRGGGPRRAVTELAEEGAVKLTDAALDQILGAA